MGQSQQGWQGTVTVAMAEDTAAATSTSELQHLQHPQHPQHPSPLLIQRLV